MTFQISINAKKVTGPYGGGNQFVASLETHLQHAGYHVYRKLLPGLDLILIVSSKTYSRLQL